MAFSTCLDTAELSAFPIRGSVLVKVVANGSCRGGYCFAPCQPPRGFGLKTNPGLILPGQVSRGGSEGQAGREYILDQRRCRDQIFEFEVEDPLDPLHRECPQLGELREDAAEVVSLLLGLLVVRDVVAQGRDDLHLQLLDSVGFFEAVALYRTKESDS